MKSKKLKLPKSADVTVIGRRWFDRVYGNTYHSAEVYVNGELINRAPFCYGYDSAYEQTAMDILNDAYILPFNEEEKKYYNNIRRLREHGIKVIVSCTDVGRRKDL